ncbi:hypothetical protein [Arthrobacter sp. ZGTC412]|uniref:hypothetical protein n=1 Tax=Arthrobacter sp. ZGTC412 TaxID=2058900 RepID=UPI002157ADFA|nr:hypothetical protein [Arthrobacter sp. ZGTC412]
MLEGQFGLVVNQAAGHHQVAGNPLGAGSLKRLDLVLCGAVQLFAGDILVDLRGPFAVGAVGAAEVTHVGDTGRALFLTVPPKSAGSGVAVRTTVGTTVEAAGRAVLAVLAVTAVGAVAPVTKGLSVLSPTETTAVALAVTTRTVAEGPIFAIAVGLAVAVTKRLALTATKAAAVTLAVTTRTITKRLLVTVAKRFTLAATETTAVTLAITTRTITKRLLVTVTKRLAVAVTRRGTLAAAKTAAFPVPVTTRTITKRLLVTVTEGLALPAAGGPVGGTCVVPVGAGSETARVTPGIIVTAEPAAIISSAVAAVVLSHVDSSCCEPTTGALQPLVSVFRFLRNPKSSASKSVHLHQF